MDPKTTSRRSFLSLALGAPVAGAALAACGGSGPSQTGAGGGSASASGGGGGAGAATYWFLSGQPDQSIREDAVKRFNAAN
ncbi:MAG: sugar ABC transporter substrate-binding protein, partial [Kineosporiaceae bacterium]